jgi:uncharacterized membrane protein YraQ (UPF0718 family)
MLILYAFAFFLAPPEASRAFETCYSILLRILPIFLLVFLLIALTNYFANPKAIVEHMGEGSGIKGWALAVGSGILSTGPIYMWYPLLNDLQKHGVRNGLVAAFLYARAIKIPLFPMLILYFGSTYTLALTLIILLLSPLQGILVEKLMEANGK